MAEILRKCLPQQHVTYHVSCVLCHMSHWKVLNVFWTSLPTKGAPQESLITSGRPERIFFPDNKIDFSLFVPDLQQIYSVQS